MKGRILLAAVLLGWLFAAAPAQAGNYVVYACSTPNGRAAPLEGWHGTVDLGPTRAGVQGRNLCSGSDPMFTMELVADGAGDEWDRAANATWSFPAPASTRIESVSLKREFSTYGGYAIAFEAYNSSQRIEVCFHANGGCAALGTDITYPMAGDTSFSMRTICGPPEGQICSGDATSYTYVRRAAVTLSDRAAPVPAGPPSGTLLEPGRVLAGTQSASLPLKDEGGGLLRTAIEIDGTRVGTAPVNANGGRCRAPYTAPVPCALTANATASLDTTTLADGPHTLRLLTSDVGGNVLTQGPYAITVRNAPTSCGSTAGGQVKASFRGGKRTVRVRFRHSARVRGRVLDAAGQPAAGAELRLVRRIDRRGAAAKVVGKTRLSGPKGGFSLKVAPGPSRSLHIAWRHPGDPHFTCSPLLRFKVGARATLRAVDPVISSSRPRGVFRGRLLGGFVPHGGKFVVLEGRQPGRGWRTIAGGRSDRRGRFRLTYRFSGTPGTFRVRARVPVDGSYPFARGGSRAVSIRVR